MNSGRAEDLIKVETEVEVADMLMRVLFGWHWLKCFPKAAAFVALIKKKLIADVIKRCIVIHDNNCTGGKITAYDLINVRGTGKSTSDCSLQTNKGRFHVSADAGGYSLRRE